MEAERMSRLTELFHPSEHKLAAMAALKEVRLHQAFNGEL
jgi:hypothetical protein